jgi:hypothetical protein
LRGLESLSLLRLNHGWGQYKSYSHKYNHDHTCPPFSSLYKHQ